MSDFPEMDLDGPINGCDCEDCQDENDLALWDLELSR